MIRIADVTVTRFEDLNKVSTTDLLAYYNSIAGKNTKQFLKRAKGMQQVWALIEPQLAQVAAPAPVEVSEAAQEPAEVTLEQVESAEEPTAPVATLAAPATAPSTAEEPAEGAASTEAKAKPTGLKARVDDLLAALASGPCTVTELAEALGMEQKKVRSTIDTARRLGIKIACVGRGTFTLGEKPDDVVDVA